MNARDAMGQANRIQRMAQSIPGQDDTNGELREGGHRVSGDGARVFVYLGSPTEWRARVDAARDGGYEIAGGYGDTPDEALDLLEEKVVAILKELGLREGLDLAQRERESGFVSEWWYHATEVRRALSVAPSSTWHRTEDGS